MGRHELWGPYGKKENLFLDDAAGNDIIEQTGVEKKALKQYLGALENFRAQTYSGKGWFDVFDTYSGSSNDALKEVMNTANTLQS